MLYKIHGLFKKVALAVLHNLPPMPVKLHGKSVVIHPRARFSIATQTFFKREQHVRKWLAKYLRPGHVFFDLGAHHGWVSMWALTMVGNQGLVVSFEPSLPNQTILEWHRTQNEFSNWTIVPKAVSDADTDGVEFLLVDAGDSPMNSLTSGEPGKQLMKGRSIKKTLIQTITLDAFYAETHLTPDVVKIDVEGAELLVLRGAKKLLSESSPTVVLAVHPYWLPTGHTTQQIFELLRAHGYTMYDSEGSRVNYLKSGEFLCVNTQPGDVARP